ncbi:MAG TPA: alkaline phosphatase PhoX, partial [Gemmatimonadaceae bacterium]
MTGQSQDRRTFVRTAAGAASGLFLAPSLTGLVARSSGVQAYDLAKGHSAVRWAAEGAGGYGVLQQAGPELLLPEGFTYSVLTRNGHPMSDGSPTPGAFDGMAAFGMPDGTIRLLRNHENRDAPLTAHVKGDPSFAYDARAGGAVSTLEIRLGASGAPELVRDFISLNGTIVNCAGGPTPWGSWLTCEESVSGRATGWGQEHGYIFEVP